MASNQQSTISKMSVTIIIINWNVCDYLEHCLRSIQKYAKHAEVIVVDNGSSDKSVQMIRRQFSETKLIVNQKNFGFGRACNQAAKLAAKKYLFFLNPDVELTENALEEMFQFMEKQPFVGLLGPKIINNDGAMEPSCRTYPTLTAMLLILTKLQYLFPDSLSMRRYFMKSFRHETLREVDQIMGAAMLIRRSLFEKMGGFDERFFIWFEEVDLCKRVNGEDKIVFFFPWASVAHQKGRSFSQRSPLWAQWQFSKSSRQYFWKHNNLPAALIVSLVSYLSLLPVVFWEIPWWLGFKLNRSTETTAKK